MKKKEVERMLNGTFMMVEVDDFDTSLDIAEDENLYAPEREEAEVEADVTDQVIELDTFGHLEQRTSVVIKPETYVKIYELAHEVNITVESLVDLLLNEALNSVEVTE